MQQSLPQDEAEMSSDAVDQHRAVWKLVLDRLETHFRLLTRAPPGEGVFGQTEFVNLIGDLVPDAHAIGGRERAELTRFIVAKMPEVTVQLFPSKINGAVIRGFVQENGLRGLVAFNHVGNRNPPWAFEKSHTLLCTSHDTATVLAALHFTAIE